MQAEYSTLTITVPVAASEAVGDILDELGSMGSQIMGTDPITYVAYFEGNDAFESISQAILARCKDIELEESEIDIVSGVIPGEDWEAAWYETLSPLRVGRRWLVRPSWHSSEGFDRETVVVDPKMAFGTGTHATTQLCLLEIEDSVRPGDTLLDVGSGTAILAMGGVLLGAGRAVAVEIDPIAVDCAEENLRINKLTDRIELVTGTLDNIESERYDLIVANIEYRTLMHLAFELVDYIATDGTAIFSGILQFERDKFLALLRSAGWSVQRVRRQYDPMTDDSWIAVVTNVV
jgi:ribosomal protein L11 methyltransferase